MLYKKDRFTVPASSGSAATCAKVGHAMPSRKGCCIRCGVPITDNSELPPMFDTTTGYHDNTPIGRVPGLTATDIARVCHEANRALCATHGDASQPVWENAPDWQIQSAIEGVLAIVTGDVTTAQGSHRSWSAHKIADGWTYGPVKSPEKKEHPCLVPFEELPLEQQAKDFLFFAIVKSLLV